MGRSDWEGDPLLRDDPPSATERTLSTSSLQSGNAKIVTPTTGNASVVSSSFNMANSAIGVGTAGVLAFPFAFSKAGIIGGILIAVVQLFVCGFTLTWLAKEADRTIPGKLVTPATYEQLIDRRLGKWMGILAVLALLANVLGAMIGFLIIIGDMGEPLALQLLGEEWYSSRVFVTLVLVVFLVAPVCALPRIDYLRFTSILSIISISFVVVVVMVSSVQALVNGTASTTPIDWFSFNVNFFTAVPIITFALTCHMQAVPIYRELAEPTVGNFSLVVFATYGICGLLYITNGSFGYLQFRDDVSDNVLNNYGSDEIVPNIARVCVVITAMFSYPLMNFVYRTALDYVLFDFGYSNVLAITGQDIFELDEETGELLPAEVDRLPPVRHPTYLRLLTETMITLVLCWIVSILVPSIGVVFGLIGASAGALITFIFPAALEFSGAESKAAKYSAGFVFCFGVFIGVLGTAVTVVDLAIN